MSDSFKLNGLEKVGVTHGRCLDMESSPRDNRFKNLK